MNDFEIKSLIGKYFAFYNGKVNTVNQPCFLNERKMDGDNCFGYYYANEIAIDSNMFVKYLKKEIRRHKLSDTEARSVIATQIIRTLCAADYCVPIGGINDKAVRYIHDPKTDKDTYFERLTLNQYLDELSKCTISYIMDHGDEFIKLIGAHDLTIQDYIPNYLDAHRKTVEGHIFTILSDIIDGHIDYSSIDDDLALATTYRFKNMDEIREKYGEDFNIAFQFRSNKITLFDNGQYVSIQEFNEFINDNIRAEKFLVSEEKVFYNESTHTLLIKPLEIYNHEIRIQITD